VSPRVKSGVTTPNPITSVGLCLEECSSRSRIDPRSPEGSCGAGPPTSHSSVISFHAQKTQRRREELSFSLFSLMASFAFDDVSDDLFALPEAVKAALTAKKAGK
jgi:hypothetical protein